MRRLRFVGILAGLVLTRCGHAGGQGARAGLERACEAGDAAACGAAGRAATEATGPQRDAAKGRALLVRGCELGDGSSCHRVGLDLERRAEGYDAAARVNAWHERACELGHAPACAHLAARVLRGSGAERDARRAADLSEKACQLGDAGGCAQLGFALMEGRGVARDDARAATALGTACDRRPGWACTTLGVLVALGRGAPADSARAAALYERGCTARDAHGCFDLGWAYLHGAGVEPDAKRANELFVHACDLNHAGGCNEWGISLARGRGTARDAARAHAFYGRACELGDLGGCRNIVEASGHDAVARTGADRAISSLTARCDRGAPDACDAVASLAEAGTGVPRDPDRAVALLQRACALGETAACWRRAARLKGTPSWGAAVLDLATRTRAEPWSLGDVADAAVLALLHTAPDASAAGARLELAEALLDARWEPGRGAWHPDEGASEAWADVATALVDGGRDARAGEVLPRVTDPYVLAGLRVDARFRGLFAAAPGLFDVDAALERQLARHHAAAEASPPTLGAVEQLALTLLRSGRADEAELLARTTVARARSVPGTYPDAAARLVWVMHVRTWALFQLGRWDEAAAQQAEVAGVPERGARNVSQGINLAVLCVKLDRPTEALAAIADIAHDDLSPGGRMRLELARLGAAVEAGRDADAGRALGYLREHREDGPGLLAWALVVAGDVDDAARILQERLLDPAQRREALLSVQEFTRGPVTPRMAAWDARWRALAARPDVRRSIEQVGRVERFALVDRP